MPKRSTETPPGAYQALINTSYESMIVSWLMQDGWQVFLPILDHGHKTDILISDGPNYYRIQIKTFKGLSDEHFIDNEWKNSNLDLIIYLARKSNWGVITPPFKEKMRPLKHEEHRRFLQKRKDFLKKFHRF